MAASTSIYVFVYSINYFMFKTSMTGGWSGAGRLCKHYAACAHGSGPATPPLPHHAGFFQTCFYFGYVGIFCTGLALLCGAVGYIGAAAFCRRIYRNVKCD